MRYSKRLRMMKRHLSAGELTKFFLRKIQKKRRSTMIPPPDEERPYASFPEGGNGISVETALNSRCTSDHWDDHESSHWGILDQSVRFTDHDMHRIIKYAKIRRFTPYRLEIQRVRDRCFFTADPQPAKREKEWLMVESGMQQQAVLLTCAALGVGALMQDLGPDGKLLPNGERAIMSLKIGPMKPSYEGSYWISSFPERHPMWMKGNLPDPARNGRISLLSALNAYALHVSAGSRATFENLSQLLWAARGRTPHYYDSVPWGMTIPTSGGRQDVSSLFLIRESKVYTYENWRKKRPTHGLRVVRETGRALVFQFDQPEWKLNTWLIIALNDLEKRGFWETGYQLLNILVQAHTLGLGFRTVFLDDSQILDCSSTLGIKNAVAAVGFEAEDDFGLMA